jgi:hypothetical protein
MLSQDERRRFNEIAHHLTTDAGFVRQVRASLPDHRPPTPWLSALCILLGVVVPLFLALRWWTAAVVTLAVLGTAIAAVLVHRHRTG